jgi:hypothetical protein
MQADAGVWGTDLGLALDYLTIAKWAVKRRLA